jgi:Na+/H+ antiporter NhaD/arsenite permease-like protein
MGHGVWAPSAVSILAFVLTYVGIFLGRMQRTIVALSGAVLMVTLGSWLRFYHFNDAVRSVDFDTLLLLLGMMIVVALFKETGFFQYLAIRAAKLAKGRPWLLLVYLGLVTSLVSTVLDNVTTIIIIVPVTVSLADILGISPLPFLLSEVLLSNIGGVATLIGDPPNILIGSAAGLGFLDFLTRLAPIVLLAWLVAQALLLLLFRKDLARAPSNVDRLMEMDERRAIVNPITTRRMLITLGATVLLFFLHELIGLEPGLVALIGACMGLLWVGPDFDRILRDLHWDVLLFFTSLFVIVGGLDASGVISTLGGGIGALAQYSIPLTAIVVLWVGALASGVISNVPFTIVMLPILRSLAVQGTEVTPLWWALAIGVGFGANLTPLGSAANVVVVSMSSSLGEPLSFRQWRTSGTWVALATCAIGTIALLVGMQIGLLR